MNQRQGQRPQKRTYLVIGLGRSGTTIVCSILNYLGVYLGAEVEDSNLEDSRLAVALEIQDIAGVQEIIDDYDSHHSLWAFKRPNMVNIAGNLEHLFRNPHYIFVHRDLFAISLRNEISIGRKLPEGLKNAMASWQRMHQLIETTKAPSLHLSFELLITDPKKSAILIEDFVTCPSQAGDFHSDRFTKFMRARLKAYHS